MSPHNAAARQQHHNQERSPATVHPPQRTGPPPAEAVPIAATTVGEPSTAAVLPIASHTAKLETSDAATSAVIQQKTSPGSVHMVTQTVGPSLSNKSTQMHKFTLTAEVETMTESKRKVSTIATNTDTDFQCMQPSFDQLCKLHEINSELSNKLISLENKYEMLKDLVKTYKRVAHDEFDNAFWKATERCMYIVPRSKRIDLECDLDDIKVMSVHKLMAIECELRSKICPTF